MNSNKAKPPPNFGADCPEVSGFGLLTPASIFTDFPCGKSVKMASVYGHLHCLPFCARLTACVKKPYVMHFCRFLPLGAHLGAFYKTHDTIEKGLRRASP